MEYNEINKNLPVKQARKDMMKNPVGYPASPAGEDFYAKYKEEKDINPEDISKTKDLNVTDKADKTLTDLDVPGSELDDEEENVGNEDEENNYYSLGGDDHNNLDENNGI